MLLGEGTVQPCTVYTVQCTVPVQFLYMLDGDVTELHRHIQSVWYPHCMYVNDNLAICIYRYRTNKPIAKKVPDFEILKFNLPPQSGAPL